MSTSSSKLYRNERPLRDIVGEQIRELIYDGTFTPGARLVERDLAERFGVSRLPVREALRVLGNDGLVEHLPSRGVVVRSLDRRQVEQLFDIREALEVLAARQATESVAQGGSSRALADIAREAHEALARGDEAAAAAANARFHDAILEASGNDLLQSMLEPLLGRLHWLFRQISDLGEVCDEHDGIAEAINAGDPEVAAERARAHVLNYRRRTLAYLFDD